MHVHIHINTHTRVHGNHSHSLSTYFSQPVFVVVVDFCQLTSIWGICICLSMPSKIWTKWNTKQINNKTPKAMLYQSLLYLQYPLSHLLYRKWSINTYWITVSSILVLSRWQSFKTSTWLSHFCTSYHRTFLKDNRILKVHPTSDLCFFPYYLLKKKSSRTISSSYFLTELFRIYPKESYTLPSFTWE